MSELPQVETSMSLFHDVLDEPVFNVASSQPPSPAFNAANSQPASPAVEIMDPDSDEDYGGLAQVCGAAYFEKVERPLSYKTKCNIIKYYLNLLVLFPRPFITKLAEPILDILSKNTF